MQENFPDPFFWALGIQCISMTIEMTRRDKTNIKNKWSVLVPNISEYMNKKIPGHSLMWKLNERAEKNPEKLRNPFWDWWIPKSQLSENENSKSQT